MPNSRSKAELNLPSGKKTHTKKGRSDKILGADMKEIAAMSQKSPEDVRKRAAAYRAGDMKASIALDFARKIFIALTLPRLHPAAGAHDVKVTRLEAVMRPLALRLSELDDSRSAGLLFSAIGKALSNSQLIVASPDRKRFRCAIVADAYADAWDTLINAGTHRRPTHGEIRHEIEALRDRLVSVDPTLPFRGDVESLLRNRNLSRDEENLKIGSSS